MKADKKVEWLLECLIHVIGRASMKTEEVGVIVRKGKKPEKQVKAYNLCDGVLTQKEIAKKARLDQGNFSRSVNRWVRNCIVFRLEEGKEVRLLYVFPIPEN